MPSTFGNEFFILVDPDFRFAFENVEIPETLIFNQATPDGPFTVTNASNTAPITITTNVAHGLFTGRAVLIENVLGNPAANGIWPIVVTGASTFQIPPSGSGVYTSGGNITASNGAEGDSTAIGEVVFERDVLAVNNNVVPTPPVTGSINYAF
jgi:hypothetical protein